MSSRNSRHKDFNATAFGLAERTDAPAPPAPPNEGGITTAETSAESLVSELPRLVTRGESLNLETHQNNGESHELCVRSGKAVVITTSLPIKEINPNAAIVDFLNCTFKFENTSIHSFFSELLPILGYAFSPAVDLKKGLHGYKHSFKLGSSPAFFAYGGNAGTGFLSFSGIACHRIPNWGALVHFLDLRMEARITRWDGAYDDFEGTHSVDNAMAMYQHGLFNTGGNEPQMEQRGNWVKPDGRGRTLYIGNSKNGKLGRFYEKGMQLGIKFHPWVRWEVQLGNRDRIIPWQAILEPGRFLAGTYPDALGWISEEQSRIKTLRKTHKLGYEALNHWHKIGYGKHINAMMINEGEDADKVIAMLRREGIPERLDLPIPPSLIGERS